MSVAIGSAPEQAGTSSSDVAQPNQGEDVSGTEAAGRGEPKKASDDLKAPASGQETAAVQGGSTRPVSISPIAEAAPIAALPQTVLPPSPPLTPITAIPNATSAPSIATPALTLPADIADSSWISTYGFDREGFQAFVTAINNACAPEARTTVQDRCAAAISRAQRLSEDICAADRTLEPTEVSTVAAFMASTGSFDIARALRKYRMVQAALRESPLQQVNALPLPPTQTAAQAQAQQQFRQNLQQQQQPQQPAVQHQRQQQYQQPSHQQRQQMHQQAQHMQQAQGAQMPQRMQPQQPQQRQHSMSSQQVPVPPHRLQPPAHPPKDYYWHPQLGWTPMTPEMYQQQQQQHSTASAGYQAQAQAHPAQALFTGINQYSTGSSSIAQAVPQRAASTSRAQISPVRLDHSLPTQAPPAPARRISQQGPASVPQASVPTPQQSPVVPVSASEPNGEAIVTGQSPAVSQHRGGPNSNPDSPSKAQAEDTEALLTRIQNEQSTMHTNVSKQMEQTWALLFEPSQKIVQDLMQLVRKSDARVKELEDKCDMRGRAWDRDFGQPTDIGITTDGPARALQAPSPLHEQQVAAHAAAIQKIKKAQEDLNAQHALQLQAQKDANALLASKSADALRAESDKLAVEQGKNANLVKQIAIATTAQNTALQAQMRAEKTVQALQDAEIKRQSEADWGVGRPPVVVASTAQTSDATAELSAEQAEIAKLKGLLAKRTERMVAVEEEKKEEIRKIEAERSTEKAQLANKQKALDDELRTTKQRLNTEMQTTLNLRIAAAKEEARADAEAEAKIKLSAAESKMDELEEQLDEERSKTHSLKLALQRAERTLGGDGRDAELKKALSDAQDAHRQAEKLAEESRKGFQDVQKNLEVKVADGQSALDAAKQTATQLEARLTEAQQARIEAEKVKDSYKNNHKKAVIRLKLLLAALTDLRREMSVANPAIDDLGPEAVESITRDVRAAIKQLQDLSRSRQQNEKLIAELRVQIETHLATIEGLTSEAGQLSTAATKVQLERDELEKQLAEKTEALDSANKALDKREDEEVADLVGQLSPSPVKVDVPLPVPAQPAADLSVSVESGTRKETETASISSVVQPVGNARGFTPAESKTSTTATPARNPSSDAAEPTAPAKTPAPASRPASPLVPTKARASTPVVDLSHQNRSAVKVKKTELGHSISSSDTRSAPRPSSNPPTAPLNTSTGSASAKTPTIPAGGGRPRATWATSPPVQTKNASGARASATQSSASISAAGTTSSSGVAQTPPSSREAKTNSNAPTASASSNAPSRSSSQSSHTRPGLANGASKTSRPDNVQAGGKGESGGVEVKEGTTKGLPGERGKVSSPSKPFMAQSSTKSTAASAVTGDSSTASTPAPAITRTATPGVAKEVGGATDGGSSKQNRSDEAPLASQKRAREPPLFMDSQDQEEENSEDEVRMAKRARRTQNGTASGKSKDMEVVVEDDSDDETPKQTPRPQAQPVIAKALGKARSGTGTPKLAGPSSQPVAGSSARMNGESGSGLRHSMPGSSTQPSVQRLREDANPRRASMPMSDRAGTPASATSSSSTPRQRNPVSPEWVIQNKKKFRTNHVSGQGVVCKLCFIEVDKEDQKRLYNGNAVNYTPLPRNLTEDELVDHYMKHEVTLARYRDKNMREERERERNRRSQED